MNTYTPTQADIEFNAFRLLFPFHTTSCNCDENEMRYQFDSEKSATYAKIDADVVIKENNMPLVAEVETWQRGHVVFNSMLVITFKPNPNA